MASKRFRDAVGIDPDRVISAAVDAALGETQKKKNKKHHPGRVLVAGATVAAAAAVGQKKMPRLAKVPLRMGMHKLGSKLGDMTHVDGLADAVRDRFVGRETEPDDEYYDDEDLDGDEYADEEEFDDEPRDEADEDEPDDEDDFDDEEDDGFDDEEDDGFDDEPEDDDGPRGEGAEADDEELDEDEPDEEEPEDIEAESDESDADEPDSEELEDEEPEDEEPEDADDEDEEIAARAENSKRSVPLGASHEANGRRSRERVPDLFDALRTPHRRPPVMRRGSARVDPAVRPPEPDERGSSDKRRGRSNKPKSKAARA